MIGKNETRLNEARQNQGTDQEKQNMVYMIPALSKGSKAGLRQTGNSDSSYKKALENKKQSYNNSLVEKKKKKIKCLALEKIRAAKRKP